jgi:DNA polymerase-3 subunit gamma/tau
MGQALYRKHRPKKLDDIVGQDHITATLGQALRTGRISHAYLFTGPRGTGKTSVARILAHEINDLPYDSDQPHIDIIEIDAASNRRIDEIRELRDKVYVAPALAKYKVYIIDEVHMLTREAFNALLKTLEEPPEHAIFILATTDAHKVPATIISRTQRFSFKPVAGDAVIGHLKTLVKAEKLDVEDDALALLAEHGGGSFRDSISLLDQAASSGQKLTVDSVRQLLGVPPETAIDGLLAAIGQRASADLVKRLNELYEQGYQAASIARELAERLRTQLVDGQGSAEVVELLLQLLAVPTSYDPARYLEIILLGAGLPTSAAGPAETIAVAELVTEPSPVQIAEPPVIKEEPTKPKAVKSPVVDNEETLPKITKPATPKTLNADIWPDVLTSLKGRHNTLYGIARMARPEFNAEGLTLACAFPFHQKQLQDSKHRQALSQIIHDLTGESIEITCIVDKSVKPEPAKVEKAEKAQPAALSTISNIFGGGELLE